MKLTKSKLKQIILEELKAVLNLKEAQGEKWCLSYITYDKDGKKQQHSTLIISDKKPRQSEYRNIARKKSAKAQNIKIKKGKCSGSEYGMSQ